MSEILRVGSNTASKLNGRIGRRAKGGRVWTGARWIRVSELCREFCEKADAVMRRRGYVPDWSGDFYYGKQRDE